MGKLNILKQHYCPWRYISNWPYNIKLFFRRYKWAYQRATRGYADCDVWNLFEFYLDLFHDSINQLADITHGYPGTEEFDTFSKWIVYLRKMAGKFYQANESNEAYDTSCWDKYYDWIEKHPGEENEEMREAFYKETIRNGEKRKKDFDEAWEMLGKTFFNLWD